jgi:hypothetical protein
VLPLSAYTVEPPVGITAGIKTGTKAGAGVLSFNFRYSSDLGLSDVPGNPGIRFTHSVLSVSFGYDFGFFNRKVTLE